MILPVVSRRPVSRPVGWPRLAGVLAGFLVAVLVGACATGAPVATPTIVPGSSAAPREVNLITRDYAYVPDVMDLVPGETILLHVINGGLVVHEAIIGDSAVQVAWETAEAATIGAPPGPTPLVTVPAEVAGLRVVVQSGERVDVVWTVPSTRMTPSASASSSAAPGEIPPWVVGCHIPGHWAKGMVIPVRWVLPGAGGTLSEAARRARPVVPSGSASFAARVSLQENMHDLRDR